MGDSYAGSNHGKGNTKSIGKIQKNNKGSLFVQYHGIESKLKKVSEYKPKEMQGMPWRMALMLRKSGRYLRQDLIWAKPNPMPESVKDRCTKSHEYIFLLSKSKKYYFDSDSIKEVASERSKIELGLSYKNKRDVWVISGNGYRGLHFTTFPPNLIKPCTLAGCPKNGIVLDPFIGSGTVGVVAKSLNRNYIGIDVNPDYCELAKRRIGQEYI